MAAQVVEQKDSSIAEARGMAAPSRRARASSELTDRIYFFPFD
jgi:hypothetical protein